AHDALAGRRGTRRCRRALAPLLRAAAPHAPRAPGGRAGDRGAAGRAGGGTMSEHSAGSNPDVRFEKTDVDAGGLLKAGFPIGAGTVACVCFLSGLYFVSARQEAPRQPPPPVLKPARSVLAPPPPHLQTGPALDLSAFREQEDRILGTYGWVDKEKEVVRIPIEDAMRLVVSRGVGPRAAPSPAPGGRK